MKRKPARSSEVSRAFMTEPLFAQTLQNEPLQIFRRLGLHAGRNFLGKKFEQKIGHGEDA